VTVHRLAVVLDRVYGIGLHGVLAQAAGDPIRLAVILVVS
jgi:hypothetical protein